MGRAAASDSWMDHLHGVPKYPTGLGACGRPRRTRETEFGSTRSAALNTRGARTRSPRTQVFHTCVPGGERREQSLATSLSPERGSRDRSKFLRCPYGVKKTLYTPGLGASHALVLGSPVPSPTPQLRALGTGNVSWD